MTKQSSLVRAVIWVCLLQLALQTEVEEKEKPAPSPSPAQQSEVTEKEVEPTVNSPMWTVFPSAVIAGLGVIFNLISLSYFIRREYDSLGSKLLMLLNTLDLMVCVTGVIQLGMMVIYWKIPGVAHETFGSLYFIFLEATGFATCLLSITRCISLYAPFYSVKGRAVALAATLFIGYTIIREITLVRLVNRTTYDKNGLLKIHIGILLGEIGVMIVVALMANVICIAKILIKPLLDVTLRSRSTGVHATVTVVILSGFFCILNVFYLITEILYFYKEVKLSESIILYFGIFYAVPLNSAVNPLIYLLRKKEMRKYLMNPTKPPKQMRKFTLGTPSPSMGTVVTRATSSWGMASPSLSQVINRANTTWEMSPCSNRLQHSRSDVLKLTANVS